MAREMSESVVSFVLGSMETDDGCEHDGLSRRRRRKRKYLLAIERVNFLLAPTIDHMVCSKRYLQDPKCFSDYLTAVWKLQVN